MTEPVNESGIERTFAVSGHVYRLVARPNEQGNAWVARIATYSLLAGAAVPLRPIKDDRSVLHDLAAVVTTERADGPTAEAALSALETRLRAVINDAIRPVASGTE
ncbi:MAG: hypothetical protein M3Q10_08825 [Chloroflexota bacterium]|nr:hypothetical protein [Chloroflexota bacterium]